MKDKRTYTKLKEHGEDMSLENEVTIKNETNEDRGPSDLTFLIDKQRKEIWHCKQKEMHWIQTATTLQGAKQVVNELSSKLTQMAKRIRELEKLLAEKNK